MSLVLEKEHRRPKACQRVYLADRSFEKCVGVRLLRGIERNWEAVCEGRCVPSFSGNAGVLQSWKTLFSRKKK